MSEVADIRGVNKYRLMEELWKREKHYEYSYKYERPGYNETEAKEAFDRLGGKLETGVVCGKVISCDLSGNTVEFVRYDYWNEDNAFNDALEACRAEQPRDNNTQSQATGQPAQPATSDTPTWDRCADRIHDKYRS